MDCRIIKCGINLDKLSYHIQSLLKRPHTRMCCEPAKLICTSLRFGENARCFIELQSEPASEVSGTAVPLC